MTDTTTILIDNPCRLRDGKAYAVAAICCPVSGTAPDAVMLHGAIRWSEQGCEVLKGRLWGKNLFIYCWELETPLNHWAHNRPDEKVVGFDDDIRIHPEVAEAA